MQLAVQNFTLRDAFAEDFGATLVDVAACDLRYCELAGLYGKSPAEADRLFSQFGVQPIGGHYGLTHLEQNLEAVAEEALTLGFSHVVVPWVGGNDIADGWNALGSRLTNLAVRCADHNLTLVYHNHEFEFQGLAGETPFDALLNHSTVQFELDVYWCFAANHDPVETLHRCEDRLWSLHLKDGIPGKLPYHCPAGEGIMDWESILHAASSSPAQYGIIELDESDIPPIEAVRRSAAYFRARGLTG